MPSIEVFEKLTGRKFSDAELLHTKVLAFPEEGKKRVVYGLLAEAIDIDYSQKSLSELGEQIRLVLSNIERVAPKAFVGQNIRVHEGGNHLDIINDGVGSMGWLIVEDHLT
ncbi:hypothetical protein GL58_07165 [Comamonas testosteroni]|uniref:Uncharacterized protein n=1 Tax=Comamonas testosteroni TaxID=285 RepID=A0A0L7MJY2_COMTE|nr:MULTISPECIES: hypothetical protein [Comamonas]KOC22241.1 hypothetical protein GL58_07165 [Comamonas testosteroni]MDN5506136.1 hypothetical protein [Comamonas sp.]MDN5537834.1 hypothetical protein [Comamonas sp.]